MPYFVKGVGYTRDTVFSVLIGIVLGMYLLLCVVQKQVAPLDCCCHQFIRGTPQMVQILLFTSVFGALFRLSAVVAGIIAIGLNSGAYVAEDIRSGIASLLGSN